MGYFKAHNKKKSSTRAESREGQRLMHKRLTPEMCDRLESGVIDTLAEKKFQQRWERLYESFYKVLRENRVSDNRCKEILNRVAEVMGDKIEITEIKEE